MSSVKQVSASFIGEKNIEILRSGGELLQDTRPLVRINISMMVEKDIEKKQQFLVLVEDNLMTNI